MLQESAIIITPFIRARLQVSSLESRVRELVECEQRATAATHTSEQTSLSLRAHLESLQTEVSAKGDELSNATQEVRRARVERDASASKVDALESQLRDALQATSAARRDAQSAQVSHCSHPLHEHSLFTPFAFAFFLLSSFIVRLIFSNL